MRANDLPPGTMLGDDFCVERKLAEGGMGTVYVAGQRSTGQRRAVKVFSPEVTVDDDLRRRFVQESRIGARIASEHIATVVAAGIEGALPWLAMELLDGETLTQRVTRAGPFAPAMARAFVAQLGHALVEAHRAGVAHRDLKPDNIFIARSQRADAEFTVKVLDFGIAKVSDALSRTTTSMSFGTPLWMAPEQMFPGAAGFSSDVWALGLVAFYALTGRVYWRAGNAAQFDTGELARERLAPRLEAASTRARALLGRDPLPRGFDAWFARCVATDPQVRYGTMVEALAALDAMLGTAPVPTTVPTYAPVSELAHAPTEWMRGPVPAAAPARRGVRRGVAVGVVALTCALGLGVWWSGARPLEVQTLLRASPEQPVTSDAPAPSPWPSAPDQRPRSDGCPQGMVHIAGARVRLHSGMSPNVASFCIDTREVTVDAYGQCVAAGACLPIDRRMAAGMMPNVCNATLPERGAHPINCVTFDEAESYCLWRQARLPTSPEWELAATGTAPVRTWPWGENPPDATRINACSSECPRVEFAVQDYPVADAWPTTAPPGTFPAGATPEGVMDLVGNVSEWVRDASIEGDGRRRWRGGSCLDGPVRSTRAVHFVRGGEAKDYVGFRCAR